jgi:hypothetical protein
LILCRRKKLKKRTYASFLMKQLWEKKMCKIQKEVVCISLHATMSDDEIRYIGENIKYICQTQQSISN